MPQKPRNATVPTTDDKLAILAGLAAYWDTFTRQELKLLTALSAQTRVYNQHLQGVTLGRR